MVADQGDRGAVFTASRPAGVRPFNCFAQRKVADAGFLELVRLGIKPAYDRIIVNSLKVVDAQLGTTTPTGIFWHRYNFDGYGETASGAPWGVTSPDTFTTHGRLWPIFAGERGEYDLAAHNAFGAQAHLNAIAGTANEGYLLPERAGIISRRLASPALFQAPAPYRPPLWNGLTPSSSGSLMLSRGDRNLAIKGAKIEAVNRSDWEPSDKLRRFRCRMAGTIFRQIQSIWRH